jgi:tRNA threonylcarbamoyladenosine biosynthesis protein TsaE
MDRTHTITTHTARQTQEVGRQLALAVKRGAYPRIVCLTGELGSGKTTFVQGFARGLEVTSPRLLSPTFIIVRRYEIAKSEQYFAHVDLYRLENESQLHSVGIQDMLTDPQCYMAIEWPERLGSLLPLRRLDISFRAQDNGSHTIAYD